MENKVKPTPDLSFFLTEPKTAAELTKMSGLSNSRVCVSLRIARKEGYVKACGADAGGNGKLVYYRLTPKALREVAFRNSRAEVTPESLWGKDWTSRVHLGSDAVKLLNSLNYPMSAEELAQRCNLPLREVSMKLTQLRGGRGYIEVVPNSPLCLRSTNTYALAVNGCKVKVRKPKKVDLPSPNVPRPEVTKVETVTVPSRGFFTRLRETLASWIGG